MRQRNTFLTPLIVEVMPNGKTFKIHHEFTWRGPVVDIKVPIGFVTDFASIPRFARIIIPKLGKQNKAAVLHDYLYQHHQLTIKGLRLTVSRKEADITFLDSMEALGVAKWKRLIMFICVRAFGFLAWRKHG